MICQSTNPVYLSHDWGTGHLLVIPTCFLHLVNCLVIPSPCPYLGTSVILEKQMLPVAQEGTCDLG